MPPSVSCQCQCLQTSPAHLKDTHRWSCIHVTRNTWICAGCNAPLCELSVSTSSNKFCTFEGYAHCASHRWSCIHVTRNTWSCAGCSAPLCELSVSTSSNKSCTLKWHAQVAAHLHHVHLHPEHQLKTRPPNTLVCTYKKQPSCNLQERYYETVCFQCLWQIHATGADVICTCSTAKKCGRTLEMYVRLYSWASHHVCALWRPAEPIVELHLVMIWCSFVMHNASISKGIVGSRALPSVTSYVHSFFFLAMYS